MTLTTIEKNRFADDISLEVMIRVLSLTVARQDSPDDADGIDATIKDLNESRDRFLLFLPSATSERQVETAKYRIEEKMKRADGRIKGLHKKPRELEFWNSMDFSANRSAFDADRFCDTADEDLDFLPF
jgi:hypothetical protein